MLGAVGVTMKSTALERGAEILGDAGAHALRGAVVGVVVAARERVGAEHDPTLHLGAEALRARAAVHRRQVGVAGDPQAVADAVKASQVRRGLGRSDDVVRGERVRSVRQGARLNVAPSFSACASAASKLARTPGFDAALGADQLLRHPETHSGEILARRQLTSLGKCERRGVVGVLTDHVP